MRAMAKDPEDRFQSAERWKQRSTMRHPRTNRPASWRRWPHRPDDGQYVLLAVVGERRRRRRAAAADGSNPAWPLILVAALLIILGLGAIAILAERRTTTKTRQPRLLQSPSRLRPAGRLQPTTVAPTVAPTSTPTPEPATPTATPSLHRRRRLLRHRRRSRPRQRRPPTPTSEPPTPTPGNSTPQAGVMLPVDEFAALHPQVDEIGRLSGADFDGAELANQSPVQNAPQGRGILLQSARRAFSVGTASFKMNPNSAVPRWSCLSSPAMTTTATRRHRCRSRSTERSIWRATALSPTPIGARMASAERSIRAERRVTISSPSGICQRRVAIAQPPWSSSSNLSSSTIR